MLTSNKIKLPIPEGMEEKEIKDGRGGLIKVLVHKVKLKIITTKNINPGALTAKGTPAKNYYPSLRSSDVPYPESKTARKKRMDAIERELDKKRLADGVEPVIKSRGKAKKK